MIHVWNLPSILSFYPDSSRSPVHTLSSHRGPITALACGHSSSTANIAISISEDKSAIVWNYHNGQALRTYLLPEKPTAVTLDPADRAFHVAYDDGSLQTLSFYDEIQQSTPVDVLRDVSHSHGPIQPSSKTRFDAESQKLGKVLSLSLSWDGTTLVSGHASGKIATWDIAKGNYMSILNTLPGPVTNMQFLPPNGFSHTTEPKFKLHTVVKPKQDLGMASNDSGLVPLNYKLYMQLTGRLDVPNVSATEKKQDRMTEFEEALTHSCFPLSMLEESLEELESWNAPSNGNVAPAADFVSLSALDGAEGWVENGGEQQNGGKDSENQELKKQLASLQRIQKVTFQQLSELREEKEWYLRKEKKRVRRKEHHVKKKLGLNNGDADGDVEMNEGESNVGSSVSGSESDDSDDDGESEEDGDEDEDEGNSSE